MRPWQEFVPPEERAIYQKAGYAQPEIKLGARAALLVVDVTVAFVGGLAPDQPVSFTVACPGAWDAVANIATLLARCREKRLPVVFTTGDSANESYLGGATKRPRGNTDRDPRRDAIPAMIAPRPEEWVLRKAKASAFFETSLANYLHRQRVDTLFVAGTSTSGCVRASVIDAFSHGFKVLVVEEAVFDRARTLHLANLFDMNAKYAEVITMQQALSLLSS